MKLNLVLQSFGKESEYKRALLTILSFYAHVSIPSNDTRVILFTDAPDYFNSFVKGLPIEYVLLSREKIRTMRGNIDFLHRMKIALIEEAFDMIDGNMFYADSDTFFVNDPSYLMTEVSEDRCFMHLREFSFDEIKDIELPAGKTSRDFVDLIESRTFVVSNGKNIRVTPQHYSWNAGVMIFHKTHKRFINDVYALTEHFFPASQHHASEQFAFSIVLQENIEIQPCDSVIYHYWYRIKKQIVDLFLKNILNREFAALSLSKKLEAVKEWTSQLPVFFDEHVLTLQDNAILAFADNNFLSGYQYAFKALSKDPSNVSFLRDILYHTKRMLLKK